MNPWALDQSDDSVLQEWELERAWLERPRSWPRYELEGRWIEQAIGMSLVPADVSWDDVSAHRFCDVLDLLYSVRDDIVYAYGGSVNLVAACNTILEFRRGFTEAFLAVATSSGRSELLKRPSVRQKYRRNLELAERKDKWCRPLRRYNPLLRFLFPHAASMLRM